MKAYVGFSLIEILISILLLAILFLGLDAMEIVSLRETKSAYYVAVAGQQLDVITELLLVYKDQIHATLSSWNEQNSKILPNGHGNISGDFPFYELNIFWGNTNSSKCNETKVGLSGCLYRKINLIKQI